MEFIHMSTVLETLGSDFDDYVYLPAIGTRGGILLAWKSRMVTADNHMFSPNTLTTQVSTPSSADAPWWLTIVYGPQQDHEKIAFLQEIRDVRANCAGPWMLCGDFNLIYRDEDKNNGNINRRMMGRFRRVINDLALKEVYLNDWEERHGECHLRCLASVVSDHSPLILDCSPLPPVHRRFHFEEYWTRIAGYQDVVAAA
ncbi:uncharacterized protein [Aegilops tauschii subsp. strangulata]|uniref:uncharacterized protein n=1 Tax=Aegilops tauschii subsp. strangulata TaxID=200361 RepID=UPI003CC8BDD8